MGTLSEKIEAWRERSQVGTACKCGAHANIPWPEGGKDWLTEHIATAHPEAFDWKMAIKDALELASTDPKAALDQLAALVDDKPPADPADPGPAKARGKGKN